MQSQQTYEINSKLSFELGVDIINGNTAVRPKNNFTDNIVNILYNPTTENKVKNDNTTVLYGTKNINTAGIIINYVIYINTTRVISKYVRVSNNIVEFVLEQLYKTISDKFNNVSSMNITVVTDGFNSFITYKPASTFITCQSLDEAYIIDHMYSELPCISNNAINTICDATSYIYNTNVLNNELRYYVVNNVTKNGKRIHNEDDINVEIQQIKSNYISKCTKTKQTLNNETMLNISLEVLKQLYNNNISNIDLSINKYITIELNTINPDLMHIYSIYSDRHNVVNVGLKHYSDSHDKTSISIPSITATVINNGLEHNIIQYILKSYNCKSILANKSSTDKAKFTAFLTIIINGIHQYIAKPYISMSQAPINTSFIINYYHNNYSPNSIVVNAKSYVEQSICDLKYSSNVQATP